MRSLVGLALILCCLSCDSTVSLPAVRVVAGPVPAGAVTLAATLNLAGTTVKPDFNFPLGQAAGVPQVSFGLFLPQGATGTMTLYVRALNSAGCVLAQGLTSAGVAPVQVQDLNLPLEQDQAMGCVKQIPQLTGVTPALVPTAGQVPLTIQGAGFLPGVQVQIGGKPVAVQGRTASTIQVTAPAMLGTIGKVAVQVVNPDGNTAQSSSLLGYYTSSVQFDYNSYSTAGYVNGNTNLFVFSTNMITLADLNKDGLPDLILAGNSTINGLAVMLNQGEGAFLSGKLTIYNYYQPVRAFTADLLGVGQTNVLIGNKDHMDILNPNKDGSLTVSKSYPGYYAGPVGDVDGDGRLDVMAFDLNAFNGNQSFMALLRGTGDASAPLVVQPAPPAFPLSGLIYAAQLADMNRDGRPDLVTVSNNVSEVQLNNGDGTFTALAQAYVFSGGSSQCIGIADLNGDGWPDIASVGKTGGDTVNLNLNQQNDSVITTQWKGMGGTISYQFYGSSLYCPVLQDVNGDQKPDLIVGDANGMIYIVLNSGDGTFPPVGQAGRFILPVVPDQYYITTGDLNNDGKLDLVIGAPISNSLIVLRNVSQ